MKDFSVIKVVLAPLLCFFALHLIVENIFYYPLVFGIILGLVNYNKYKFRKFFNGFFLILLFSYLVFFIAYFSLGVYKPILKSFMSDNKYQELGFILTVSLTAPLLLFLAYKFVFYFPKTLTTIIIIFISIVVLFIELYFIYNNQKEINFYLTNEKMYFSFVFWQIVMALALQLIMYQKELKILCKYKNR